MKNIKKIQLILAFSLSVSTAFSRMIGKRASQKAGIFLGGKLEGKSAYYKEQKNTFDLYPSVSFLFTSEEPSKLLNVSTFRQSEIEIFSTTFASIGIGGYTEFIGHEDFGGVGFSFDIEFFSNRSLFRASQCSYLCNGTSKIYYNFSSEIYTYNNHSDFFYYLAIGYTGNFNDIEINGDLFTRVPVEFDFDYYNVNPAGIGANISAYYSIPWQ